MINLGAVRRTSGRTEGIHAEYYLPPEIFRFFRMEGVSGFCGNFEKHYMITRLWLAGSVSALFPDIRVDAKSRPILEKLLEEMELDIEILEDAGYTDLKDVPACFNAIGTKKRFTNKHEQVHAKFRQVEVRSKRRMNTERMIYMGLMRLLGPVQGRQAIEDIVNASIKRGWSPKNESHLEEGMAYGQQLIDFLRTEERLQSKMRERKGLLKAGDSEAADKIPFSPVAYGAAIRGVRRIGLKSGMKPIMRKIEEKFGSVYRFIDWMEANFTPEMVNIFTPEVIWISSVKPIESLYAESEPRRTKRAQQANRGSP